MDVCRKNTPAKTAFFAQSAHKQALHSFHTFQSPLKKNAFPRKRLGKALIIYCDRVRCRQRFK